MKTNAKILFTLILIFVVNLHPAQSALKGPVWEYEYSANWEEQGNRIWIGPQFWSNPMEGWRIQEGRLECIHSAPGRNIQFLSRQIIPESSLRMHVRVGRLRQEVSGRTGFYIAIEGPMEDYRHALIFGKGIRAGISTEGYLFVGNKKKDFDFSHDLNLSLRVIPGAKINTIVLSAYDDNTDRKDSLTTTFPSGRFIGNIGLIADAVGGGNNRVLHSFYFEDLRIVGNNLIGTNEQDWGPILWTQYTLSHNVLKLSAQFPPMGKEAEEQAFLEVQKDGKWQTIANAGIHSLARNAIFRVSGWNSLKDHSYRVRYTWNGKDHTFEGTIRRDPVDQSVIKMGVSNCDHGELFPLVRFTKNVELLDPDLMFFPGDQIYEGHGGFGVYRGPDVELAMINYLRKYFLFGWSWRDVMRNRPSVIIPDDHDVFQGNLWGHGGRPLEGGVRQQARGGYLMPADWVNAVQRTQTGHLPDPFDPEPVGQGIEVYFTDMVYGRVGFAVLEDRKFKSGPLDLIGTGAGNTQNPRELDVPEAELLGGRQEEFLRDWVTRWEGTDMKAALSQTLFCKGSTHQGMDLKYRAVELDCNGWPQSKRDRALDILRRGYAFMVHGDQHLSLMVHHGIEEWEDAGAAFLVTGTSVGFLRAWWPDSVGLEHPAGKSPYTGRYFDHLQNRITVMAAGNPDKDVLEKLERLTHPEERARVKGSGLGMVEFNKDNRTITTRVYRVDADLSGPEQQALFSDWPVTIDMEANYGRKARAWLPEVSVKGLENPVVQVINEKNGETEYTLRTGKTKFRPKVFEKGKYTVRVGDPDTGTWRTLENIRARTKAGKTIEVNFQ